MELIMINPSPGSDRVLGLLGLAALACVWPVLPPELRDVLIDLLSVILERR
ncbi:hypothetical protein REH65_33285 (plasmid) [Saccharopolyspora sp. ID03-671]|uniref:hypothetical protein n=1 Tax=Saccharopolyspora sp. ID03-671 TaxID=3073066 RepID=UPI003247212D